MGQRTKVTVPKRFIDKYGENITLWSYSKISTFNNCVQEYFLNRIKKYKSEDNIYTLLGSRAHDIIQDYYDDKIKYESMAARFESEFLDVEISDYKFSNEEHRNYSMKKKYKECVTDFLHTHQRMAKKVATEKIIWVDVESNVFIGYVDAIHKDEEGNVVITDWKTSTIYKGKKINEHAKQLLLYALGLIQGGVDINKVKVRWNFLKYCDITYQLKNKKMKTSTSERNKWVQTIKTPLKKDIVQFYTMEEWEADLKVDECIKENSLQLLDESIQNKYQLSDSYVYVDVTEESIEELKRYMVESIKQIQENGENESNWERGEIDKSEEFYCSTLCGVSSFCSYYKRHLQSLGLRQKSEEDIIKDLEELDLPWN